MLIFLVVPLSKILYFLKIIFLIFFISMFVNVIPESLKFTPFTTKYENKIIIIMIIIIIVLLIIIIIICVRKYIIDDSNKILLV